jgi:large subunit ribosomal protein L10
MAKVGQLVKAGMAEELGHRLAGHPNFFVTTVTRLPAAETDAFRQKLFTSRARLVMVKRRLGQRAAQALKVDGLSELFEGSVGLVLAGDDVLIAAKTLVEFRKTHEEQLTVRGAVIDGQLLDRARVEQLASLPPRPVLLTQVVFTVESPIADVLATLEQLIGDLAWVMEQAAAMKPASTPAEAASGPAPVSEPPPAPAPEADGGPPPEPAPPTT